MEMHNDPWRNLGLYEWMNQINKQKKSIYYLKKREKECGNLVSSRKRKFQEGTYVIVAWFSYNEKLKIKTVRKNVKINSKFYQEKVLSPIFTEKISFFIFIFILVSFIELNFIKNKEQVKLQKVQLYSLKKWKLIQILNKY